MRLRADGRGLDARHLCAVAHAAGNGSDTVENLPAACGGPAHALCDPADDLKNLRRKPHTGPRRAYAAERGGYLVAVVQQVLDHFLYPCRYIRQGCAEVVDFFDAEPGNVFQNRQEIVSDLNTDSPPCVAQHRQYRFGGFAFQQKLLVHTAVVFRSIAHVVQRLYKQVKISGQLCAGFNGPLSEQRFQVANLFVFRLASNGREQALYCRRCVRLHILCKLFRGKAELFKCRRLCVGRL